MVLRELRQCKTAAARRNRTLLGRIRGSEPYTMRLTLGFTLRSRWMEVVVMASSRVGTV